MEKLDEILRAEGESERAVAVARERASADVSAAEVEARAIVDRGRTDAAEQARALRESLLSTANATAGSIATESATSLDATIAAARDRLPSAIDAALRELVE